MSRGPNQGERGIAEIIGRSTNQHATRQSTQLIGDCGERLLAQYCPCHPFVAQSHLVNRLARLHVLLDVAVGEHLLGRDEIVDASIPPIA